MQGKEFSMNYFNLGIAVGFFTVTLLVLFRNRLSKDKQDCYDERQVIVRGKGYQYAFFTTMGLLMLYAAFAEPIEKYMEAGIIPLAILLFSGLILMGYCLFHDAFWGLISKKNKRMGVTVWALYSVLNIMHIVDNSSPDKMWIAGRLSSRFMVPLLLSIFFAIALILMLLKNRMKNDEE